MVTKYISSREKINDYCKNFFSNPKFESDKEYFVANMCIDLGCKKEIVIDIIRNYINAGIIYEEFGFLKNSQLKKEMLKTDAEKEADVFFNVVK